MRKVCSVAGFMPVLKVLGVSIYSGAQLFDRVHGGHPAELVNPVHEAFNAEGNV